MVEPPALMLVSVFIQSVLTLLVGYALWRIREFSEDWEYAQAEREKHDSILMGGYGESDLFDGLVDVVELHDQELQQASDERREIKDKLEYLKQHAVMRNDSTEPD